MTPPAKETTGCPDTGFEAYQAAGELLDERMRGLDPYAIRWLLKQKISPADIREYYEHSGFLDETEHSWTCIAAAAMLLIAVEVALYFLVTRFLLDFNHVLLSIT